MRTSGQTACRFAADMTARTAYDEVRYSNYPYAQTHPDRLATVAALHGLPSPDPATARVLEIGCGAGGNLLAMAVATPGIRALGIDLASEPIAEGRAAIEQVGISNVQLRQGDVSDLRDGGLGEFDYVIAHGVYAWVPESVREDLLAAIHAHLAADGLAYVSYNANPGGYMRRALRDAGLWFAGDAPAGVERAERARGLYRFLYENRAGTEGLVGRAAGEPARGVRDRAHLPARARRPLRPLGARVVRRLRRRARPPAASPTSATRTSRPCCPSACPRGDGRPRRVRGRRSRRARAADRRPALRLLPPVGPVPRQPHAGSRAGPGRAAPACTSPCARASRTPRQPGGLLGSALALLRSRAPDTSGVLRAARGDRRRAGRALRRRCTRASWPRS